MHASLCADLLKFQGFQWGTWSIISITFWYNGAFDSFKLFNLSLKNLVGRYVYFWRNQDAFFFFFCLILVRMSCTEESSHFQKNRTPHPVKHGCANINLLLVMIHWIKLGTVQNTFQSWLNIFLATHRVQIYIHINREQLWEEHLFFGICWITEKELLTNYVLSSWQIWRTLPHFNLTMLIN